MGTNYYLNYDYCPCCGNARQRVHIGKTSKGWKFLFDAKSTNCENIEQIKEKLRFGNIKNEYGDSIGYQEFFDIVENMQSEMPRRSKMAYSVSGYEFNEQEFS